MLVYKITNTSNGKIYIGKTTTDVDTRWKLHLKHAFKECRQTYFCNALRKYGPTNVTIKILIDNISNEDILNEKEISSIKKFNSTISSIGYNTSKGGDGGFTKEMRQKSADIRKERGISPEHLKSLIEGRRKAGYKPKTPQQKQEISQRLKQYYKDHPEHHAHIRKINKQRAKRGKEHPMWGRTHTPDVRRKLKDARKGKTYEELFGEEKAKQLKDKKRKQVGNKNPNYNDIDNTLLNTLHQHPRITRKQLCYKLGCSGPTLTKRFKLLLDINNIQQFRRDKTIEELKSFFEVKLNDFNSNR